MAPFVAAVCHPDGPDASGRVFEVGAGYMAEVRWERSNGAVFKPDSSFTPSAVCVFCFALHPDQPLGKSQMVRSRRLLKAYLVRADLSSIISLIVDKQP